MEEDGQMCIDTFTRCFLILIILTILIVIITVLLIVITQLQEHEDKVPTGFCLGGIHSGWQDYSDCNHH